MRRHCPHPPEFRYPGVDGWKCGLCQRRVAEFEEIDSDSERFTIPGGTDD